ncbi:MAG TPA: hypothetical protein VGD84_02645 [Pseudonocardiaceae bacterium]
MVAVNRIGRTFGVLAVGAVLAGALTGCAKAVHGTALAIANPTTAPAGSGSGGSGTPTTPAGGGNVTQQAQQTCSTLPKAAVTSAFGVPDVTVTTDSGTTLSGGIIQIQCVITSSSGFRANVIVQVYPSTQITTADQYFQIMQGKYPSVQKLNGINGADVAGIFQDTPKTGSLVDEAFAAKTDTAANTVDVVIAGVADTPGIQPKLVSFVTALASP